MLTGRDCRLTFQEKATSIKVAGSGLKEKDCWLIAMAGSGLKIRPLTRIRSEKRTANQQAWLSGKLGS